MPQFTTITSTHVPRKKEFAWKNFHDGGYIAIGWLHEDLTGKSINEVVEIVRSHQFQNEEEAIDSFRKFIFVLRIGDYVAVNNVNHGLFGIGTVESDYQFKPRFHRTGSSNPDQYYSNIRRVSWIRTKYIDHKSIALAPGEHFWRPRGTMGEVLPKVPQYIHRILIGAD